MSVFRLHGMHNVDAAYYDRYHTGRGLSMYVCLSVLVTQMRPAKLAEPIEGLTLVGPVLDGGQDLMNPFAAGRGD